MIRLSSCPHFLKGRIIDFESKATLRKQSRMQNKINEKKKEENINLRRLHHNLI